MSSSGPPTPSPTPKLPISIDPSTSTMQYVNLGRSGLQVSRICLGCMSYGDPKWQMCPWVLDEEQSRPFILRALQLGINFFDTANGYSNGKSEEILGKAIKDYAIREQVVIATKVFFPAGPTGNERGLSRKHIMDSVNASLKRLQMEYIDLLQIHRWDDKTPIEETMEALHDLIKSGKVRYIGCSSVLTFQLAKAQHVADKRGWTKFISMQNLYNLLYREEERDMIPLCEDEGVSLIPWSPLANGLLAATRERAPESKSGVEGESDRSKTDFFASMLYNSENDWKIIDRVKEVTQQVGNGVKAAQVSLAWLLSNKNVAAPIIGATKMYQLEDAAKAVSVKLTDAQLDYLEEIYTPKEVTGIRFDGKKTRVPVAAPNKVAAMVAAVLKK